MADAINPNFKFAWVDRIRSCDYGLYSNSRLEVQRIDKQYGDWLNIWYELTANKNLEEIYYKMIGNVPELTTFDRTIKPAYILYIPLQFWFNRFNGLAIPLVALQYHDVYN